MQGLLRQLRRPATGPLVRPGFALVALLLAGAGLCGCSAHNERETRLHAPGAVLGVALDVEHDLGGVTVRVDPSLERAVVVEEFRAGLLASGGQKERLARIVAVESEMEDSGEGLGVLRIRTTVSEPLDGERVNLRITMPRCDGVRIRAAGGDVVLVGVTGAIQVENERDIEVRTNVPLTAPVALLSRSGDVYLQMPQGSAGRLEAESGEGKAMFRSDLVSLGGYYARPHLVRGVLDHGVNPMVVRSDTGDVRIIVMDDPESLSRWRAGMRAVSQVPGLGN